MLADRSIFMAATASYSGKTIAANAHQQDQKKDWRFSLSDDMPVFSQIYIVLRHSGQTSDIYNIFE